MKRRIIYVCSPLREDIEQNLKNARIYCRNIAKEYPDTIPLAPHLYCTQFLDDNHADERELGITYGMQFLAICDELWAFGLDCPSEGMKKEIRYAKDHNIPIRNGFHPDKIVNPITDSKDLTHRMTDTPIVFLDFDGVLNHAGCDPETNFLPEAISVLNRLYDEHDIRIVLSTSWTHSYLFTELQALLKAHGLYAPVIDKIPEYAGPYPVTQQYFHMSETEFYENRSTLEINGRHYQIGRDAGILHYIQRHNIKHYVILDDLPFSDPTLKAHTVQTCWHDTKHGGLREHHYPEILKILDNKRTSKRPVHEIFQKYQPVTSLTFTPEAFQELCTDAFHYPITLYIEDGTLKPTKPDGTPITDLKERLTDYLGIQITSLHVEDDAKTPTTIWLSYDDTTE